jgi:hypothetical protein
VINFARPESPSKRNLLKGNSPMPLPRLTLRSILGVLALCGALACFRIPARADETAATAPEKIELRLNLQKGQVYDEVMATQQKTSQTFQKTRLGTSMMMRLELHNEVLDVSADGNARVRATYRRVQVSVESTPSNAFPAPAKFSMDYDSVNPPKTLPPGVASFAALVGQSFVVTMSPEGKNLKVEGLEELVERMLTQSKVPAAVRAQMKKLIQASMNETAQERMCALAHFPDYPVGIGDKWQSGSAFSATLPVAVSTEYTLLARQNGVARIGVASKLATNDKANRAKSGTAFSQNSISGQQSGVLSVDEKTGWTQSGEIHQRASGKISSGSGGKTQSWPIYIASTIRVSSVALQQK